MYSVVALEAAGTTDSAVDPAVQRTAAVGVTAWSVLATAGAASGAYHGYRRNKSVGWAIAWAVLGAIAPVVTIPVSLAQGFGKPK